MALRPMDVSAYRLPDEVELCGQPIDLGVGDTRERIEKEFYLVLGDRAQVVLWLKRARRVFPTFEEEARKQRVCSDLKYLAVVESGLRPRVTSHASARGWWQFMQATGRAYGLDIDAAIDQRADLDASTGAGIRYLAELRERFGDWALAMAAYNTGPTRLAQSIDRQGVQDYWRLELLDEAERYVPRIVAVKAVLDNLEHYGFQMGIEDGWAPEDKGFVRVRVPTTDPPKLLDLARGTGIDYRTLRRFNPEWVGDRMPTGKQVLVRVPPGKEARTRAFLEKRRNAAVASAKRRKDRVRNYTVRPGDSLWLIADKHGVDVKTLRRWNGLGRGATIHPGQRLVVRR